MADRAALGEDGNRGRILAAARTEFIAKGVNGARMQAIADRAGVNKALIHYYFGSKDNLYRQAIQAVFSHVWSTINTRLGECGQSRDLRVIIHTIVETYMRTLIANHELLRLILREIIDDASAFSGTPEALAEMLGPFPDYLTAALDAERSRGRIRPLAPQHLMLNLIGMCIITFLSKLFFDGAGHRLPMRPEFNERFFEERIGEIVTTACNGIFIAESVR